MHILGLDLGSRTIGIAMSNSDETIALMKETFRFSDGDYDAAMDKTIEYIDNYNIKEVALGFPKHMNGDIGEKAKLSIEFKEILEEERDVHVELIDERLTTVMSLKTISLELNEKSSKRKSKVDSMAAQTILQDYLDRKKKVNSNGWK